MSKKRKTKLEIQMNKKDSNGLFINFPKQVFDSKEEKRQKKKKSTKQYLDEIEE